MNYTAFKKDYNIMKCKDIIEILEELSPTRFASDWDNIGLMVGDKDMDVKKILIALDGDDAAIDHAIDFGVDLIVTHHPLIFKKLNKITSDELTGKRLTRLIHNNISLYSMHTNFDVKGGMAQIAADIIGIYDCDVLEQVCEGEGFGRVGSYDDLSVRQWAERVKQIFNLPNVCVYGDLDRIVNKIAISPGSGKDFIENAVEKGAQLFITGDINHHGGIDANALGLEIIDAGHYGLEHIFIEFISKYLKEKLSKDNEISIIQMPIKMPFVII